MTIYRHADVDEYWNRPTEVHTTAKADVDLDLTIDTGKGDWKRAGSRDMSSIKIVQSMNFIMISSTLRLSK